MGIGRILYLTFGCMVLFVALMLAMNEEDPENMQRAQVFALGGIGLMVAGAACGAAERRTGRPPQAPQQPPDPQHYPPQGHNPQQGYAAPQGHNLQQGYTVPQGHHLQQGHTAPQGYGGPHGYAAYPPAQNG
ncbi:hypothetical protein ACSDR0_04740 [Streptosporangium sp. G11]|uniref:hypothetical protein n=1 Tax=Streptosporangium sp. G11 TaxID=3436926 RepID=UPI003EBDD65F